VFGVALNGCRMRFDLSSFVSQRAKAGDDGLLFAERGQRYLVRQDIVGLNTNSAQPRSLTSYSDVAPNLRELEVGLEESRLKSCSVDRKAWVLVAPRADSSTAHEAVRALPVRCHL